MYKDLGHRVTTHVYVLNLLWSDVFTLSQLKDVFLPVYNLQSSILKQ